MLLPRLYGPAITGVEARRGESGEEGLGAALTLYLQALASGVLLGGVFALMALGFSLIWGILEVINLSHFAVVLVAAYATYEFTSNTGMDPFLVLVITIPIFFVGGALLQLAFDKFDVTGFNSLLVTFGLFVIAEGLIRNVWGADFVSLSREVNRYGSSSVFVGDLALPISRLVAFGLAIPIAVAAAIFLKRSYVGKAMRAVAEDPAIAAAFGVNHRLVSTILAGSAAATAAIAGVLVAVGSALFPSLGQQWIGIVFAVVILGGIGSPLGAVAASALVGGAAGVSTIGWGPAAAPLVTFLLLIIVLIWRPKGLFRKVGT